MFKRIIFLGLSCLCGCASSPRDVSSHQEKPAIVILENGKGSSDSPRINVESEPKIEDYRPLPGDKGNDERVEELLIEAISGKTSSLLLLGEADVEKGVIMNKIRAVRTSIAPSENEPDYVEFVLAKLGDIEARNKAEKKLFSGEYVKEEEAVNLLEYVGDQWSIFVLEKGLLIQGGDRLIFAPNDPIAFENVKAPPIRFKCVASLDRLLPGSGVQLDIDLMKEVDVQIMRSWVTSINHKNNTP